MNAANTNMPETPASIETEDALSSLPVALRNRLGKHFEWIKLEAGQEIIREGDRSNFLLLVVSGGLEISKQARDTRQLLGFARPGSVIGELGILTNQTRYASCRAVQPSEVGVLTRERFWQLRQEDPDLYLDFVLLLSGYMANRLVKVTEMVNKLKQQNQLALESAARILQMSMGT